MRHCGRLAFVAFCFAFGTTVSSAQEEDALPLPGFQGTFSRRLNATLFPTVSFSFAPEISNYVTDWNIAVQWTYRKLDLSRYGLLPPRGFVLMHLAQWQALLLNQKAKNPVNSDCLVAYLSHLMYNNLYPKYSDRADALLEAQAANFTDTEQAACKVFAAPVVTNLLIARGNDGSTLPATFTPAPAGGPPGEFEAVSEDPDLFSNYANGTTFLVDVTTIPVFVNDTGPPPVGSDEYDANFVGYAEYGSANTSDSIRSSYQTASAYFWYATNGTSGSQGQWNQIALVLMPATLSLLETAELLAKLNVASWDMYILVAKSKYKFKRWRPITAVRLGDCYVTKKTGCHEPEPDFEPLLVTPNNPVYPSHAGGYAGAGEGVLKSWLGGSEGFSIGSEVIVPQLGRPPRPRRYISVTQAAREVCASRIYGGIEAPNDALAGREYGLQVAEVVEENFRLLDPLTKNALPAYAILRERYDLNSKRSL